MYKRILTFAIILILTACISCTDIRNKQLKETEEEKMQKVYNETVETELMLGLWVTPATILTQTQEEANARYKEIRESGITMVYTFQNEIDDPAQMQRALNAAYENGIKVIVFLPTGNNRAVLEIVEKTKDHPSVIGYNLQDEPKAAAFIQLSILRNKLKEVVSEDKIIMCNMLPNYAKESDFGSYDDVEGTKYQVFLEKYMQIVKPDVLSFDHYPFKENRNYDFDKVGLMLKNLCDIRNTGARHNVDTWGFAQNSSWKGSRIPNENELRFICHLHLIFGLKSYSYFLYCQPTDQEGIEGIFEGMLTYHGEKTDIYYRVQHQNQDLKAMKGVFLNYTHEGFVLCNLDAKHVESIDANLVKETYKELSTIESEGRILTGCFDKEGKTGLYVMNFDYNDDSSAILNLSGKYSFKVWGAGGLEQMKESNTINVQLKPGEGKFIEIG